MDKEVKVGAVILIVFIIFMFYVESKVHDNFIEDCISNDLSKFECEMYWQDRNGR